MRLNANIRVSNSLGVMQGRLTSPKGRGIQFFPFDNWQNEFKIAKKMGLDEIEFIFDYYKYRKNPLWTKMGRKEIKNLVLKTGVKVNSVCADYFMRKPFFRSSKKVYSSNCQMLKRLIRYASEIEANLIEIPFVDNSSIKNNKEEALFVNTTAKILPVAEKYKIKIGLETDLQPQKVLFLIKKINHTMVGANYDTGNSASLGYNPKEELNLYGEKIFNVHIKDRMFHGSTVQLGTGDTKFIQFFNSLKRVDYKGSLILQAARGKDGDEQKTIRKQIKFLKLWI